MAGSHLAGARHAAADLFAGRPFAVIATPQASQKSASAAAGRFARRLGARPMLMSAPLHDRLAAATSALPQLAATALTLAVYCAAGRRANALVGPGFLDTTRLASSPFAIWRPSLLANAGAIRSALRTFRALLLQVDAALERGHEPALARFFLQAAAARRRVVGG